MSEVPTQFVDPKDAVFIRNGRDLAALAFNDVIYSEAFRAALILNKLGAWDATGPYADAKVCCPKYPVAVCLKKIFTVVGKRYRHYPYDRHAQGRRKETLDKGNSREVKNQEIVVFPREGCTFVSPRPCTLEGSR